MTPRPIFAIACLAMLLGACASSNRPMPQPLPVLPSDLRLCFVGAASIPDRDLTVAEVEALWKDDRTRAAAMRRCGRRLVAWYDALQRTWR